MSVTFDPVAAAQAYAEMETEELVRIAYLEPDYVPEAKALALRELDKRGVPESPRSLISKVREEITDRVGALERLSARNREQAQTLNYRVATGLLICALWFAALFAPSMLKELRGFPNGAALLFLGIWIVAVVNAVRRLRKGSRRQLYLVVVVPSVLLVIGIAIRLVI